MKINIKKWISNLLEKVKGYFNVPCERCGAPKSSSYYRSSTETTLDYCELFGDFLYEEPMHLCFACTIAYDSFLRALIMLAIEKSTRTVRYKQIKEAEKVWGDNAMDTLALLQVAHGSMDSARRILKEDEFNKLKPWLEKNLPLPSIKKTSQTYNSTSVIPGESFNFDRDDNGEMLPTLRNSKIFQELFNKYESDDILQTIEKVKEATGDAYMEHTVATMFDPRKKNVVFHSKRLAQKAKKKAGLTDQLDQEWLAKNN